MNQNGLTSLRKLVEPPHDCETKKSAVIVRLSARQKNKHTSAKETHDSALEVKGSREHYRDAVCGLCEHVVSMALSISLREMRSHSRCKADIAMARQIAMYLAHTKFSILMTEVGLHFRRDRTTVSYACAQIEDRRDDFSFDLMICQLEALLGEALAAISHSQTIEVEGHSTSDNSDSESVSLLAHLSFLDKGNDE